jgi:hypothetical protein
MDRIVFSLWVNDWVCKLKGPHNLSPEAIAPSALDGIGGSFQCGAGEQVNLCKPGAALELDLVGPHHDSTTHFQ